MSRNRTLELLRRHWTVRQRGGVVVFVGIWLPVMLLVMFLTGTNRGYISVMGSIGISRFFASAMIPLAVMVTLGHFLGKAVFRWTGADAARLRYLTYREKRCHCGYPLIEDRGGVLPNVPCPECGRCYSRTGRLLARDSARRKG